MRQKRVLHLLADFHPTFGGAERNAFARVQYENAIGGSARVVTRRIPGTPRTEVIGLVPIRRVTALGQGFVNSITFAISSFLYLLLTARTYDVILVSQAGSPALAGTLAARLVRKRILVTVGGGRGIGELAYARKSRLARWKFSGLRILDPMFVLVARDQAQDLAEANMTWFRYRHIPNGVDVDRFRPLASGTKRRERRRAGWDADIPTFLYAGRFSREKGLLELLDAWNDCIDAGGPACLILLGSGPLKETLEKRISELGLESSVVLKPPSSDMPAVYPLADVFVLPSFSEGCSNALLEAMSSGLPSLVSRIGESIDAVQEGVSGFLFTPGDCQDLRRQLRATFAAKDRFSEMGGAARNTIERRYTIAHAVRRYTETAEEF